MPRDPLRTTSAVIMKTEADAAASGAVTYVIEVAMVATSLGVSPFSSLLERGKALDVVCFGTSGALSIFTLSA